MSAVEDQKNKKGKKKRKLGNLKVSRDRGKKRTLIGSGVYSIRGPGGGRQGGAGEHTPGGRRGAAGGGIPRGED